MLHVDDEPSAPASVGPVSRRATDVPACGTGWLGVTAARAVPA